MYRLLIVTDKPGVIEMFQGMTGWEKMGFHAPRLCANAQEAIETLRSYYPDAIVLDEASVSDEFNIHLDTHYPNIPLCQIAEDEAEQRMLIQELYRFLSRLNADDSDDAYDASYKLSQQRERWLKQVVAGLGSTREELSRQLRLYRCRERLDVPCVLARLEMTDEDGFLSNRWHYGGERLEQALRNFFGCEHDHMLMHVAVVSQDEVRVLCYPANVEEGISENVAFDYVQETVEQVDHYLGLHMKVLEVRRVPGLAAFASDGAEC